MRILDRIQSVAIAFLILAIPASHAQTPLSSGVTYQGQLMQSGSPADGAFPMVFTLWDAAAGGAQVGPTLAFNGVSGNPPPVAVTDGLFSVVLDFGANAYNGDARWLEIAVNGVTLAPRSALTAVPYAVQTRGIFVNNAADRVGIGTLAPTHPLHVFSPARRSALVESPDVLGTWLNLSNTSAGGRFWRLIATGSGSGEGPGNLAVGHGTTAGASSTVMTLLNNGRVGVGTATPKQRFHNVGDYYGRGQLWLHSSDGDGQDGAAYVQAADDSGTSSIGLRLRTQDAGVLHDAVSIAPDSSVSIGGGLTVSNALPAGLDQSQDLSNWNLNSSLTWQSFTAGQTGRLTAVDYRASSSDPPGSRDAQLTVYAGTGAGGAVLGTQSYVLQGSGGADTTITLSNPVYVTAGQVYTLHFQKTGAGVNHTFSYSDQNPYPGGLMQGIQQRDLLFRTYMQGDSLRIDAGAIRFPDNSYQATAVRTVRASEAINLASIPANSSAIGSFNLAGAELGGSVCISPDQDLPAGLVIAWARVSPAGVVRFGLRNTTASAIDPPLITFHTSVINP